MKKSKIIFSTVLVIAIIISFTILPAHATNIMPLAYNFPYQASGRIEEMPAYEYKCSLDFVNSRLDARLSAAYSGSGKRENFLSAIIYGYIEGEMQQFFDYFSESYVEVYGGDYIYTSAKTPQLPNGVQLLDYFCAYDINDLRVHSFSYTS